MKLLSLLAMMSLVFSCSDEANTVTTTTVTDTVKVTVRDTLAKSIDTVNIAKNDTIINNFAESKVKGTVSFYVTDKETSSPIGAATISAVGSAVVPALTDSSSGFISFPDLQISNYYFLISKTGYAPVVVPVMINDNGTDVPRVPNVQKSVELSKLGVTVTGVVYYTDFNGQRIVVKGANVDLNLTTSPNVGEFKTKTYTVATDSNGVYSFTNLPEQQSYSIAVDQITVNGNIFSTGATKSASGLNVGAVKQLDEFILSVQASALQMDVSNKETLSDVENLYFTFSKAVDVSKIKLDDIVVKNGATEVGVTTAWSEGNTKLTITSISGIWKDGASYSITLALKSLEGLNLNGSSSVTYNFSPASGEVLPGQTSNVVFVTPLKDSIANSSTTSIELFWREVASASKYKIYRKTNEEDVFTLIATVSDDTSYVTATTDLFTKGKSAEYKVVSANSLGSVDAALAPSIIISDKVAPGLTAATATEFTEDAVQANADATPKKIGATSFAFDEAMDTNVVPIPAIDLTAAPINHTGYSFGWKWNSETTATLSAYLATGVTKTDSVVYNVVVPTTNLKDLAANKLGINSNVSRLTQKFFWKE